MKYKFKKCLLFSSNTVIIPPTFRTLKIKFYAITIIFSGVYEAQSLISRVEPIASFGRRSARENIRSYEGWSKWTV